jgi:excisionase family DNA binding protein
MIARTLTLPEARTASGILTVVEVAALLRCSKAHIHNLINGKVPSVPPLPAVCLGRRRLVRLESLVEWIEVNERTGTDAMIDPSLKNHAVDA